jgi:hypothetical protein
VRYTLQISHAMTEDAISLEKRAFTTRVDAVADNVEVSAPPRNPSDQREA